MNPEAQIIGERLARDVAARAAALDLLNEHPHIFSWSNACIFVAFIAGNVWLSANAGSTIMRIVCSIAPLGLLLGVTAYIECIRLRRRVNAVLILVHQSESR